MKQTLMPLAEDYFKSSSIFVAFIEPMTTHYSHNATQHSTTEFSYSPATAINSDLIQSLATDFGDCN